MACYPLQLIYVHEQLTTSEILVCSVRIQFLSMGASGKHGVCENVPFDSSSNLQERHILCRKPSENFTWLLALSQLPHAQSLAKPTQNIMARNSVLDQNIRRLRAGYPLHLFLLVKVDGILWWMVSEASTGIIECESCPQQLKCKYLWVFNKYFLMVQTFFLNVFKPWSCPVRFSFLEIIFCKLVSHQSSPHSVTFCCLDKDVGWISQPTNSCRRQEEASG